MYENYDRLVTEIAEKSELAFRGQEFFAVKVCNDVTPNGIISGSERTRSAIDPATGTRVEIDEQHLLIENEEGEPTSRHYLQIEWDEEEWVIIDLEEGRLNEGSDTAISVEAAVTLARRILRAVCVVTPDEVPETSEIDLSPLEQLLFDSAFDQLVRTELAPDRIERALADDIVLSIARRQLAGDSYDEDKYKKLVEVVRFRYELSVAEVDQVVDMKMHAMLSDQNNPANDK